MKFAGRLSKNIYRYIIACILKRVYFETFSAYVLVKEAISVFEDSRQEKNTKIDWFVL